MSVYVYRPQATAAQSSIHFRTHGNRPSSLLSSKHQPTHPTKTNTTPPKQIEHRLFPGLPSDKLPLLAPVVKATCHDFGIHYQEFAVRVLLGLVLGVCMRAWGRVVFELGRVVWRMLLSAVAAAN